MKLLLKHHHLSQPASFNPALPEDGALIIASVLRDQFNGLKSLIDAIASVNSAVVDGTSTLPAGFPAEASVSVVGNVLHFTFSIPQGNDGQQGPQGEQGPPGEVTFSDLNSAISAVLAQTSANSNAVSQLGMSADGSYQQWQIQAILDKLDELIAALRRL